LSLLFLCWLYFEVVGSTPDDYAVVRNSCGSSSLLWVCVPFPGSLKIRHTVKRVRVPVPVPSHCLGVFGTGFDVYLFCDCDYCTIGLKGDNYILDA
jgi:hypothetical protein